ncbi:hypothetical protein TNCV_595471, partial [Trichonephila clavipes]
MQQFKTGLSSRRVKRIRKQGGEGPLTLSMGKYYKEEEAKELLEVIRAERLETEQQQKLERQEQLSIEKLRFEIESSRNANQSATQNNGQTSRVKF